MINGVENNLSVYKKKDSLRFYLLPQLNVIYTLIGVVVVQEVEQVV